MLMHAAIALALLQSPSQFDLVCTGHTTRGAERGKAFSERIRVDLEAERWCKDDCDRPVDFFEVTPSVLTLERTEPAPRGLRITSWTTIDRTTGAYQQFTSIIGAAAQVSQVEGQCVREAFSGMPAPRF